MALQRAGMRARQHHVMVSKLVNGKTGGCTTPNMPRKTPMKVHAVLVQSARGGGEPLAPLNFDV